MMMMRDHPPPDAPEPFKTVGVRIRGGCRHQRQMLFQFGQPGSRTSREPAEVGVFRFSAITMAPRPRCWERARAARTRLAKHIGGASGGNAAIKAAITPVQQAKARHLAVLPRGQKMTLLASPFSRPDTRESGVKGHLHLIEASYRSACGTSGSHSARSAGR